MIFWNWNFARIIFVEYLKGSFGEKGLLNINKIQLVKFIMLITRKAEYFFSRNNFLEIFECHFPALVLNQITEILVDAIPIDCTQFTTSSWNCHGCDIFHRVIDWDGTDTGTSRGIRVQQMIKFLNNLFHPHSVNAIVNQFCSLNFYSYLKVNVFIYLFYPFSSYDLSKNVCIQIIFSCQHIC